MNESLSYNKKINLDYEILERFEAGIELIGLEVKSVRKGLASLVGSHITIRGGEAYIISSNIPAYQENNTPETYDAKRNRKLLLKKEELQKLSALEAKKGLTIVPISMYSKGAKIKVEIAIVRGKKAHDKRQDIKKRDTDREIRREYTDR